MKKKLILILCVLCLFGFAMAESHKVGPYPNYKGTVEVTTGIIVPTTVDFYFHDPFGGEHHVASRGGQEIEVTYQTPLFAHSYAEFESEDANPFDPITGSVILTEIWTRDLDPGGPGDIVPPTEGFFPPSAIPDVLLLGPGFYTGRSGMTYYTGPVEIVTVADLANRLAGYDVGMIMGPPDNIVYITQATVPASEIIIEAPSPYFLVDSMQEWEEKLAEEWPDMHIRGLTQKEGDHYLWTLHDPVFLEPGSEPYSPIEPDLPEFIPVEFPTGLYVWDGDDDDSNDPGLFPDDAGLVMKWGDETTPGERASAWKFEYGDPDLTNCMITVQVTPPGPSGINRISLGLQDVNGNIRSWWWNVPGVIPYGGPTTVTIDTTLSGLNATNPPASGSSNNPGFDLTKVQSIIADENANWVGGPVPAPAPGGAIPAVWNYWHNLSVMPKLPGGGAVSKWFIKYSQKPEEPEPGKILGWDEVSLYGQSPYPMMADDWECADNRPVTDIHWWGSFKGWTQPHLPPILPSAFHIAIWTDVKAGADWPFSHPGQMIWENTCDTAVWNFAGYDIDPRCEDPQYPCEKNETCFQWAQFLSQDEWFRQKPMEDGVPNVYWLSIAAIYPPNTDFASPDFYPWGWKTRRHFFNDDAIRITDTAGWPPVIGVVWTGGTPVEFPEGMSWDLAFELTTCEPGYVDNPIPGDIAGPLGPGPDGTVDLLDFSLMASHWLETAP